MSLLKHPQFSAHLLSSHGRPYSVEVKGTDLEARLVSCETLNMSLNLSEPRFPGLQNGNGNHGAKLLNYRED